MEEYYVIAIDVIREFDKVAPYEMYSGGSQIETSFLLNEIRSHEEENRTVVSKKLQDTSNIDFSQFNVKEVADHIVNNSYGIATFETAEKYARILVVRQVLGRDAAMKEFGKFLSDNRVHYDSVNACGMNSFYIGCLHSDGIINEAEMEKMTEEELAYPISEIQRNSNKTD